MGKSLKTGGWTRDWEPTDLADCRHWQQRSQTSFNMIFDPNQSFTASFNANTYAGHRSRGERSPHSCCGWSLLPPHLHSIYCNYSTQHLDLTTKTKLDPGVKVGGGELPLAGSTCCGHQQGPGPGERNTDPTQCAGLTQISLPCPTQGQGLSVNLFVGVVGPPAVGSRNILPLACILGGPLPDVSCTRGGSDACETKQWKVIG